MARTTPRWISSFFLSEHEGFSLPLSEAMRAHVPAIAYDAGAVGETVSGVRVLVGALEPAALAKAAARLAAHKQLKAELCERQAA